MEDVYKEENVIQKLNLSVWKDVIKYLLPHWPQMILLFVGMIVVAFYNSTFVPSVTKCLTGAIFDFQMAPSVFDVDLDFYIFGFSFNIKFYQLIIVYLIMIILRSIFIFVNFLTMDYFVVSITTDLRKDTFKKIQELSYSYYDKTPSGWLIARLQNDTASIGDIMSSGFFRIIWIAFELLFTLVTMFTIDVKLSLIILSITPIIAVLTIILEKEILKAHRTARNAYSNFVRWLAESINGNKTIKTMSIEEIIYKECDNTTEDVRSKRFRAGKISAPYYPALSILNTLTVCLIIIVFPKFNIEDSVTYSISTLILFINFTKNVYDPITAFSEILSEFMATQANVEKVFGLLKTKPALVDSKEVIEKYGDLFNNKTENFEKLEGDIKFENLSFSYNERKEVIHNMNLHIEKGTSVAIVGETGSGKSTTVNLLCRFYEPTIGKILIDNVDYKERSVGWIRSNLGYVQQSPFIFKGTIYDNIRYGKQSATNEEIEDICKKIGLESFVLQLDNGYNTILKDKGEELSQGQKQLISFARALVRNPAILILDEATSSIDTETESIVQNTVNKILKGRTSIIIAHRLSTIVDCDRILVMSEGRVIEDGNHKSLMEQKGAYYNLYMNQFKDLSFENQLEKYNEQITKKNIKL